MMILELRSGMQTSASLMMIDEPYFYLVHFLRKSMCCY